MMIRAISLSTLVVLASCALDNTTGDQELAVTGGTLTWVGDTHVRVGSVWLPPTISPAAGRDLDVYTQTYPVGAAHTVELFWADDGYSTVGSVAMVHDADHVGTFGSNTQWRGAVPNSALAAGQLVHYWVRAQDAAGNAIYDSRNGANYDVRPQHYHVGWIGGLGSYRPTNGDYVVGGLFNDDSSTSTGCWNHGVSFSSYRARAARVWIPGLSDRDLNDQEQAAVAAMIRFEVYSDVHADGWAGAPARLVRREGNDFLYQFQFVTFNPGCVIGLGDGTFGFKLRASTDDGASWLWHGSANGNDLRVQYAARCSYFNNPFDCIPTETSLTRNLPGGPVQIWAGTTVGATSTFTKELIGGDRPITVGDISLVGPDADQFSFQVFDVGAGTLVDPAGPFTLNAGDELRLILVHAPSVASPGVLPHQATITWTEASNAPPQTLDVTGIHLRGTTAQ